MSGSADRIAQIAAGDFAEYCDEFAAISAQAAARFQTRNWHALQEDSAQRLELYTERIDQAVTAIEALPGAQSHEIWGSARALYQDLIAHRADAEIGKTFFSSITRRMLKTEGTDPAIEFTDDPASLPEGEPELLRFDAGRTEAMLVELLVATAVGDDWQNLERDVRLAALEIQRRFALHGEQQPVTSIEAYPHPFYRGRAAYVVGSISGGALTLPLAIAIHRTSRGLVIGAVLVEQDDISVLFSYTRASFMVAVDDPGKMVNYLGRLMQHRKPAELFTAIGYNKHGKTERYRDLRAFIDSSGANFEHARGIRGMVMIVFTLPGYDAVFKVIRDRFPYPKQTTRRQVMSKYRMVFRHDRAGRLIDAHEFEHMRFAANRFDSQLLAELETQATRSITVEDGQVTLHHVYVERKVVPLDIYLRENNPLKGRAAMIDYGRAIKNLAMSDIFPGDMLLKNFGVTRSGRVVFYDYDELTSVTECNFRELPQTMDPDREMSADPWFGVGDHDVFPEEFRNFLGVRGELREVLEQHHGDLFGVRFWQRVQDRVKAGEVIEIFPYERSRRLGAGVRRRTSSP
ncbi:MAG: bifunctional isocitrate dehydrogenase kinase/phosphatase [Acidimicrobiia bacterium]|nr:bifunctional isocitrate dehydrogenase kinase/phosphatase [Acidimicrobiia bacterium]MDX2468544.1 bifunctional isocitrate dehydrogenase kinase/phosphatase [Acidimicrobiia bacterium]